MGGWLGGNQVENHATSWSNLQDCKISSRVEIPKLDPSVAIEFMGKSNKTAHSSIPYKM